MKKLISTLAVTLFVMGAAGVHAADKETPGNAPTKNMDAVTPEMKGTGTGEHPPTGRMDQVVPPMKSGDTSAGAATEMNQFEGTWNVADTEGKAFGITLGGDGSAKADRAGEGMTGTWKEEGSAAVITWDTGWTTKISKDGDKYTKTAFKKGEPMDGKPANSSPAEKAK